MKYSYIMRRKNVGGEIIDMGTVEIPENMVKETLKRNPLWSLVGNIGVTTVIPKAPAPECPLCDMPFKSNYELDRHKRTHV